MAEQHGKNVNGPDDGLPPYAPYPHNPVPPVGPPQYPGWTQNPPPPPTVTVQSGSYYPYPSTTATVVPAVVMVGPEPTRTVCRSCNQEIVTRIDKRPTMRTHLMAVILCLIGCWPCAVVPYCVDSCLNTEHYCSNCGAFVGTYIS